MKQKSKPKRTRHHTRWLSLLLAAALCVVVVVPIAVNRTINKMLANAIASGTGTFKLHHIGLTRSIFSATLFSDPQTGTPPAKIDSCVLTYRPLRLLRGKIDTVHISGLSLLATAENGTVKLPAITLFSSQKAKPKTGKKLTLQTLNDLPVSVSGIRVDGHILLKTKTERHAIPIHLKAESISSKPWGKIAFNGSVFLSSAHLTATGVLDTVAETLSVTLNGALSTDDLPYTLRQSLPDAIKKAAATLDAEADFQLDGTALHAFTVRVDLGIDATTSFGNIICSPHIDCRGTADQVTGSISGIEATTNYLPLKLGATNIVWQHKEKALDGRILLNVANNPPLFVTFHSDPQNTQAAIADTTNGWSGAVYAGGMRAKWTGARLTVNGGARAPAAIIPPLLATFCLDELTLKNKHAKTLLEFPDGINAHAQIKTTTPHIIGQATLNTPNAILPKQNLAIRTATLNCNNRLDPAGFQRLDANLQANTTFRDVEVASFNATLERQNSKHYHLNTSIETLGITGRVESVITTSAPQGFVMSNTLSLAEQTLDLTNLSSILPETAGVTLTGKLSAESHYTIRPGKHNGAITAKFSEGSIEWPKQKLSASDIQLMINLPELPLLRSRAQFFGFKNFRLGRIAIDSGIAIFRMQDPSVWYLNNLILNWCGGKIRGESTRIARDTRKNHITLHANHILLPEFLEQLGIGVTSSEGGRMNGSLPMLIENGKITVTDGFLHSIPGETSHIKLVPTARLKRTAATSIELSLAIDALSDFTYSWLRLTVDSDEEDLNIKFEMDGKPANKLYYTLSEDTIIATRHANTFKGILMDANFRLPLNEVISIATPTPRTNRSEDHE